jgi:hypothetical protein
LSVLAAFVNIPIKEKELVRAPQGSATAASWVRLWWCHFFNDPS